MSDWRLILETSGRTGKVGLAKCREVVHAAELDEKRRHVRDLTSTIQTMLETEKLNVRDLAAILVSVGPGGYTGLRVGLTTAKVLAYAANVPMVAVPTFHAIAAQAPLEAGRLWVIADALQGKIYLQFFEFRDDRYSAWGDLLLEPEVDWLPWAGIGMRFSGPGLATYGDKLPKNARPVPAEHREPRVDGMLIAAEGLSPLGRDELFRIEPLYLRGSSAEEKAKRLA